MPSSHLIYEMYKSGKYADMKVICDDGTELPMSKAIVCSASKTIDRAMSSPFKESQTSEYHLPGKESAIVCIFFDILHGKTLDNSYFDPALQVTDMEAQILCYAKVYSLADELQADEVLQTCVRWVSRVSYSIKAGQLDLLETISFLDNNAGRKDPFLRELIPGYFLTDRTRLSMIQDGSLENQYYEYIMGNIELRATMVAFLLSCRFSDPSMQFNGFIQSLAEYEAAIRSEKLAKSVMTLWLAGRPLNFETLGNDPGFAPAIQESGLSYKLLQQQMDSKMRLGNVNICKCNECSTIIFNPEKEDDCDSEDEEEEEEEEVECRVCDDFREFTEVTTFQAFNGQIMVLYNKVDGKWIVKRHN